MPTDRHLTHRLALRVILLPAIASAVLADLEVEMLQAKFTRKNAKVTSCHSIILVVLDVDVHRLHPMFDRSQFCLLRALINQRLIQLTVLPTQLIL